MTLQAGVRGAVFPTGGGDTTLNPALQALKANQYQQQTKIANQNAQNQVTQDQYTKNDLRAQDYALGQSYMLQQNANNPRTVTDTSMTISNGGSGSASGSSSSGSRTLPPGIQGHFMPLIQMGSLDTSQGSTPPRETRPEANYTPQDATAYQDAAYGRLKARAGQEGRSAVDSLAGEMAGRGIGGSGTFARGVGDRIASAVQPLSDLNVAHLGDEYQAAGHARDLSEAAANTTYQGNINQRGQDISAQQALEQLRASLMQSKYQGEIAQRGQDYSSGGLDYSSILRML